MPARRDLDFYRSDTWTHEVRFVDANEAPVNVSAWTFASQVRRRSSSDLIVSFAVDASQAASGVIVFSVGANATDIDAGRYKYDVQRSLGGVVQTVVEGAVTVSGDITQ
jgi:hypothetical protein